MIHPALDAPASVIQVMAIGAEHIIERRIERVAELSPILSQASLVWVNVDGLGSVDLIQELGTLFGLHPLALEDVVNVHQHAKVDPYDEHLYIVTREPAIHDHVETEQISIFLGRNYVLTFQERPGDSFHPVRERIRRNNGHIRKSGPSYLAYALLDSIIDAYFPVLEVYADRLDHVEDALTENRGSHVFELIHAIRNDLLVIRRAIRPHRELINELIRDEHPCIQPETRLFLRDCYDHAIQLIDLVEIYRETCGDLRDYSLAITNQRMNEVMKVLTIIATIFMPLGFIAGIYGMNFDTESPYNMPELHWRFGYFVVLGSMALVAVGFIVFLRRRGWLSSDEISASSASFANSGNAALPSRLESPR